ncbi:ABC transporter substrate-binding protein [Lutispora thermophila]|uniref:Peptide/nickel transport system substrate-binding protein n=1 Tax=Lutispora thermophila DSM 19022 TaxID=1122184 RepID=A0A1M6EDV6_9FIRM|nr:glutathione ABC transporter substrate-binding protein [Lutispora thermophila]SHI83697.1 peptide/nickel transport system substrate-binding protein [Lutispora thermophila DSM 19022]
MKKLTKVLALALAFTLLLAGCGGSATQSTSANEGQTAETQESELKDTVIFAQGADVTSLDPHIGKETPAVTVHGQIFDTLLATDKDMNIIPGLAESWEILSDTSYKFNIRKGVKFHDGSELTAEDVKFSLDRAMASSYVSYIVNFIDNVEVVDNYTVIVNTKEPYAPTLMNLTHPSAAIVPKAIVEKDPEALKTHPIGTGPYKFVEWKPGEYAKLEANPDYFRGAPKTKYVIMKVIPEAAQRTIALETGEVDIAYDLSANDLSKVAENSDLKLLEGTSLSAWFLQFNTKHKPFDNKLVRQAIRYAIDSQTIVDTLLYGAGEVAGSIIPPVAFGYQEVDTIKYNKEKAKELLAQAGYPNGFDATLYVNDNQQRIEICQVIQSQLKEVGINVEVKVLEFATFIDSTNKGEHDMGYYGWVTSTADADYTYYPIYHSSQHGAPGNRSFIANADIDKYIEEGRVTTDPAARLQSYKALEQILTEESPVAPLYYSEVNVGTSKKVQGFEVQPAGYHSYLNVTVSK